MRSQPSSDAFRKIVSPALALLPGSFLVEATSPGLDDLYPAVLVFRALERVGVSRDQLAFALCRTLADEEASNARTYLSGLGYSVLAGDIPERLDYRKAMSQGRAITEASQELLSAHADTTIGDLLARAGCVRQQPTKEPMQRLSDTA